MNLSNGSIEARFTPFSSNEANFCFGYDGTDGKILINYSGATNPIKEYVFCDGKGNAVFPLSKFALKSDLTAYLSKTMVAQITSVESITKTGLYYGKFISLNDSAWQIAFVVIQGDGAGCLWAIDTVQCRFFIGNKTNASSSWKTKEIS